MDLFSTFNLNALSGVGIAAAIAAIAAGWRQIREFARYLSGVLVLQPAVGI